MDIILLGASGSIGQQTIDVIEQNRDRFSLVAFSVGRRHQVIPSILERHPQVKSVYLIGKNIAEEYQEKYPNIKFLSSDDETDSQGICKLIEENNCDMVVNALVGFIGLVPSVVALNNNRKLALANKESLVVGGEIINDLLKEGKGALYPIDSEHSALWKCLKVDNQDVDKLVLTASGGAFRKLSLDELENVTPEDALKHPTWQMGNKITIDCATMVNKAFELIEAYQLFGYMSDQLGVKLHDESLLHSYVIYKNGLCRGEYSKPDMRNPIRFALFEGECEFETVAFNNLEDLKDCHFHDFSLERYPLVGIAYQVIEKGGNLGAIFNASNEVAVRAFLDHKIKFLDIDKIINQSLKDVAYIAKPSLQDLLNTHQIATELALKMVKEVGNK